MRTSPVSTSSSMALLAAHAGERLERDHGGGRRGGGHETGQARGVVAEARVER